MFCYGILSVEMDMDSISGDKSNPHKRNSNFPLINIAETSAFLCPCKSKKSVSVLDIFKTFIPADKGYKVQSNVYSGGYDIWSGEN